MHARVAHVVVRDIPDWDEFTGRFQALQRVEIRARVGGYLQDILFEDGEVVRENDVLFVVDQRPFQIAVERAQAQFDLAVRESKRAESLLKQKAISLEDYEQRIQEKQSTKADLDAAQLDMEFTEVKAPFSGRISRNRIDIGSLISGGSDSSTHLTTLVSVSPIGFYFEASESNLLTYMRAREQGLASDDRTTPHPVFLKLKDEEEFKHQGVVDFVDNELDANTSTLQIRAIFPNENGLLEPGLFARLRVAWREPSPKILVPAHVIGSEQTRKFVYTLDANNNAERSYVKIGGLTDDGMRVIRSGLTLEDRIIVGNLQRIRPNSKIEPIMDSSTNGTNRKES